MTLALTHHKLYLILFVAGLVLGYLLARFKS